MMKYFRVVEDVEFAGRWHLSGPAYVDGLQVPVGWFSEGKPRRVERPAELKVSHRGVSLDYSETEYQASVISEKVRKLLSTYAHSNFECVPASIAGVNETFHILTVTSVCECVDEARSEFEKFAVDDPVGPELAGRYRIITKLVIDATAVKGLHLFRIRYSESDLVVSERVRDAFVQAMVTGIRFWEAYPDAQPISDFFR